MDPKSYLRAARCWTLWRVPRTPPQFQCTDFPWGSDYYRETGRLMPEDGLEQLEAFDAILFGAVGDPHIPDHVTLHGLLLPMRRTFDQGVCIRPAYLYPGVESPLAGKRPGDIDLVIFRENTEGEYAPVGGRLYPATAHETVIQTNVFTRRGTERIIRAAFEFCERRGRKNKVTSVTKSNAQAFGMVFWDEVFQELAAEFPNIETESLLVDRACMDFVRWPEAFDVVVASNLFADILSDIAAVVTGSMGLAPSANINPERIHPSMFEPVHGAAFDITGKGIANPPGHHLRSCHDAGAPGRKRRRRQGGPGRGPMPERTQRLDTGPRRHLIHVPGSG